MRNFKMTLCYEGTRYRGWQKQGNTADTIQEKLEKLLSRLLEQEIEIAGSGRTDAGVHAVAQVASFHAETDMTCADILCGIRAHLPEDIGIVSLEEAEPRFHARLNACEKTYLYRIWNSEQPCVFERRFVYPLREALDMEAMQRGAERFCGTHDFSAFSTGKKSGKAATRTIYSIRIERIGPEIRIEYTGNGFLYNMVRILTGTLVEIGLHQRSPEDIDRVFASGVRAEAGFTAPAKGLALFSVRYDRE